MRKIGSFSALEKFGRIRMSKNFFMRDFMYSEISNFYGVHNIPDDPELAIRAGIRLCEDLLELLNASFGRIAISWMTPRVLLKDAQDINGFSEWYEGFPKFVAS